MEFDPFVNGNKIIETIELAGEEAYFVGGAVRDLLLGRPIRDIDIATSALPESIQKLFQSVIPIGIEHGTVLVRYDNDSYEVTTFRLDGHYSDQRRPDEVQFIRRLDEDLKRRDFTINALAMDREGKIIDLFHGKEDLEKKIIRTVGEGHKRFSEDALRMFRAIRFASQLGFTIEEKTVAAILSCRKDIETVAVERLLNELSRLFSGAFISYGIKYLQTTKIAHHLPIFTDHADLIEEIQCLQQPLHSIGEIFAFFNYLYPSVSIRTWVKEWKASNDAKKEAKQLLSALSTYEDDGLNKWLLYQLPTYLMKGFYRLLTVFFPEDSLQFSELEQMQEQLPISSRRDLAIDGGDIVRLFPEKEKGPWIERMLRTIEEKVIFGELDNHKYDLKEWMKCNPPKIS